MTNRDKWIIAVSSMLVVVTSIFVLRRRKQYHAEKPPKKAPQIHIENPGSQDDFPKPPLESEVG